jgi:hypothetical protein
MCMITSGGYMPHCLPDIIWHDGTRTHRHTCGHHTRELIGPLTHGVVQQSIFWPRSTNHQLLSSELATSSVCPPSRLTSAPVTPPAQTGAGSSSQLSWPRLPCRVADPTTGPERRKDASQCGPLSRSLALIRRKTQPKARAAASERTRKIPQPSRCLLSLSLPCPPAPYAHPPSHRSSLSLSARASGISLLSHRVLQGAP